MQRLHPRVLMITGRADPGGGPEHVFQLSRQLLNYCSVFIASPREEPFWNRYVALVGELQMCEIPHRHFSWSALRRLATWARKHHIEILHSHGRAGGLYGRLLRFYLKCPVIHTPNCPLSFRSWNAPFYWFADFVLSLSTARLIAVSLTEAQSMRRQFFGISNITVIFNGVQLPDVRVDPNILSKRPLHIIHVTRFVPQKNSEMVLDILDQLRSLGSLDDFHVDIVGDGPGRAAMEKASRSRGLNASLSFHGSHPTVRNFFLNGFCILTTSRWEGLPIAVLEALALGLPAFATNTPGNNDVVSQSVGRLFSIEEPLAAAHKLTELRDSDGSWRDLSDAAVSLIHDKYSVKRMAADTLALYNQPLGRSPRF